MKRILVVDDEPNVRLNYRITLDVEGYEVKEASDAKEAIQLLHDQLFDLAILDLRMPGTDGLELLRLIREEGIPTPAVIITAYSDVPNAVRAMKLGAIDFLQKPLRPAELRTVVSEIIGRHDESTQLTYRSDFDAHLTTAKRLINIGNFDAARPYLVRALEINDSSPEAFNLAGVLAELKEDHDRARKMYGRAIKLDKNFEPAQQNMRRLFEMHHFGATKEPINMGND
jgi:DNA-binding response OmpR family regulator